MRLTQPLALLLLLLLPVIAAMGSPAPGSGRRRDTVALGLRLLLMLLVIASLAGLEIRQPVHDLAVVFLLDHSDSMPVEAKSDALGFIRTALGAMGPADRAAIVVFGAEALVERAMSSSQALARIESVPDPTQTDLAEAIRLGLALFPSDAGRRMVILSDGVFNDEQADRAAGFAEAMNVELVAVPFETRPSVEIALTDIEAPDHLRQGERFDLVLNIEASAATSAEVRVFADGALVASGVHELTRGLQALRIPLQASEPGFVRYQVQIAPQADTYYQNNELSAFTRVLGPPRILIVAPIEGERIGLTDERRPDESSYLKAALEASGYLVDQVRPAQVPSGDLSGLAAYSGVILVDVPARQLTQRQMRNLQAYVRDLGGGLVVVGGPTSFGVGGYYRTPLEETLPVEMQIEDQARRPSLAMVFVIDRSGSMSSSSGGAPKIELAKEAAARSVELLFPGDRVGVVAFDDSASWVVEMTDVGDSQIVVDAIGSLASGGGTDILAGLQAVARVLPQDSAAVKHVILLTDGGANPSGIPELVSQLWTEHGISLTTIGIGSDAADFLADLAVLGGGRYHFAPDPESIPAIFTEETALVSRSYIVEESFFPEQASPSPILTEIQEIPALHGYVATSAKDLSQVVLASPDGDPILALWQYGLGRSLAFTSDATARWAVDWLSWQGYVSFWGQAVRAVAGQLEDSLLQVEVVTEDGAARVQVEASSEAGDYQNGLQLQVSVIAPDGSSEQYVLRQVAPGRYEAAIASGPPGAYLIRVVDVSGESTLPATVAGWVLPYSSEYQVTTSGSQSLVELVQSHGGWVNEGGPDQVLGRRPTAEAAARPVRSWVLPLAAILLVADIAARRLVIGRSELLRGWTVVRRRLRWIGPPPEPALERLPRVSALFAAKERAARPRPLIDFPIPAAPGEPVQVSPTSGADSEAVTIEEPDPLEPSPTPSEPQPERATTAARLLALKRDRHRSED